MKKYLIVILTLIIFSLCSCSSNSIVDLKNTFPTRTDSRVLSVTPAGSKLSSPLPNTDTPQATKDPKSLIMFDDTRSYYDLYGTINGKNKVLEIYWDGKIRGRMIDVETADENPISGTCSGNTCEFSVMGPNGKIINEFTGKGNLYYQNDLTLSSNGVSHIFSLEDELFLRDFGKRYDNLASDQQVEQTAFNIRRYIKNSDKQTLSDMICYPIYVYIKGKTVTIKNKAQFLEQYNQIITPEDKKTFVSSPTKALFQHEVRVMFGNGSINAWLDILYGSKLLIVGIN